MELTKCYEVPFDVNGVYHAWVSSNTVIPPATAMDIEPVVGGHYRLLMDTPEFSGKNEGKFSLVEPCERVVYTWEWNGDGEVTEIDVRFEPAAAGTTITIRHSGFTSQESVTNHDGGWDGYMIGLGDFLSANTSR
jgi:uncharacterized protein YndB with AHSA1/START domain